MGYIIKEEMGEGESPSSINMNIKGGNSTRHYVLATDTPGTALVPSDIHKVFKDIIGSTSSAINANGSMFRNLPKADPHCPWLLADSVNSFHGIGPGVLGPAIPNVEAPTITPTFGFYPCTRGIANEAMESCYRFNVSFSPRPYAVSGDDKIKSIQGTWFEAPSPPSAAEPAGTPFSYVTEWQRFCDFEFTPIDDWVTQQKGTMKFDAPALAGVDGQQMQNVIKMFQPNEVLTIKWYQVPYNYVISKNSYLFKYRGRVNQFNWNGPFGPSPADQTDQTTAVFPAGSLLYLNYKAVTYTPPLQALINVFGNSTLYQKVCDVEMNFLHTTKVRPAGNAPVVVHANYVPFGNNLQNHMIFRNFYYAVSDDGNKVPAWLSFPIELLWKNPDIAMLSP